MKPRILFLLFLTIASYNRAFSCAKVHVQDCPDFDKRAEMFPERYSNAQGISWTTSANHLLAQGVKEKNIPNSMGNNNGSNPASPQSCASPSPKNKDFTGAFARMSLNGSPARINEAAAGAIFQLLSSKR